MSGIKSGIKITDVSKNFKETKALSHINLHLEEGMIYGLLGRNGAGKSTLLNIISNRVNATEGLVTLDGDVIMKDQSAMSKIFLVNEKNLYPEGMKVKEAFTWAGKFYSDFDMDYAKKLSEQFGLPVKKKIKNLSTGYQSIFKNILALSVNTPYVFLDEPVLGLDAYHRDLFYKLLIEKYALAPFTAVISTHLIEEVTNIVEHIVIIKDGQIIRDESRDNLLKNGYCISGPALLVDAYIKDREIIGQDSIGGLKTAYLIGAPESSLPQGLEVSSMDLQKLFIQLTGE